MIYVLLANHVLTLELLCLKNVQMDTTVQLEPKLLCSSPVLMVLMQQVFVILNLEVDVSLVLLVELVFLVCLTSKILKNASLDMHVPVVTLVLSHILALEAITLILELLVASSVLKVITVP